MTYPEHYDNRCRLFLSSRLTLFAVFLIVALAGVCQAQSDDPAGPNSAHAGIDVPEKVDQSVDRALKWLADHQGNRGAFPGKHRIAYTALAALALMSDGRIPDKRPLGNNLKRAVTFLVQQVRTQDGYPAKQDNSRMYGHALTTLALLQAYGMMPTVRLNMRIKTASRKALDVILQAQKIQKPPEHTGGWRYKPDAEDSDLSVTAWQILVLHTARQCGFDIPQKAFQKAHKYVTKCYDSERDAFCYQPDGETSDVLQAAGILAWRMSADNVEKLKGKEIPEKAVQRFLSRSRPEKPVVQENKKKWLIYQAHHLARAAAVLGKDAERRLLPRIYKTVLPLQQKNGVFRSPAAYDRGTYATAIAILTLNAGREYMPLFDPANF